MTNKTYKNPLNQEVYRHLAQCIAKPLILKESGFILCPPLWGKEHILRQLKNNPEAKKIIHDAVGLQKIIWSNCQPALTEPNSWLVSLAKQIGIKQTAQPIEGLFDKITTLLTQTEQAVIINVDETCTDEQLTDLLLLSQKLYYLQPNRIHFVFIIDHVRNDQDFYHLISPFRSVAQNFIRLSMHADKSVAHLIGYWSKRWQVELDQKTIDTIIRQSGGILLFSKAVVRSLKIDPMQNLECALRSGEVTDQVKLFFYRLTEHQQSILKNIANGKTVEPGDELELENLAQMGIISIGQGKPGIVSPLLRQLITEGRINKQDLEISIIQQNHLTGIQKQVLLHLIRHDKQPLLREALAKKIWGEKWVEKYSDWALDQFVYRLRKALEQSNIPFIKLTTQKKVGIKLDIEN